MSAELDQLRRSLAAQEAWGKWNTGPIANRIGTLEDELRPAWLRSARHYGILTLALAYCVLAWLAFGAGVWGLLGPLVRAMMGQG